MGKQDQLKKGLLLYDLNHNVWKLFYFRGGEYVFICRNRQIGENKV